MPLAQAHFLQSQALVQAADERVRQQERALQEQTEQLLQEKQTAQLALLAVKAETDSVSKLTVLAADRVRSREPHCPSM